MTYFELSLRRRMLLAVIPSTLFLLPVQFEGAAAYGHAALFGALVMAPFISRRTWLILRFGLVVVTPMLMTFALIQATNSEGVVPHFLQIQIFGANGTSDDTKGLVFDLLEMALLLTLLPALVLTVVAPLKVSWKYWLFASASGVLTIGTAILWVKWFWCIWFCNWWDDLLAIIPYTIWALSFCVAIHFGRIDFRRVAGGAG